MLGAPRNRASFSAKLTILIAITVGTIPFRASAQAADAAAPRSAEPSAPKDGDIIVTAQRRRERLTDVPVTISAFRAEQLEASGVASTIDLPVVTPGLQFGTQAAYGQPFIRGVGTTGTGPGVESPIALYVDGVYYGAMIGSVLTLNNIDQVEVLKGPQGTLFGRNATGGLIQITTRDPSHDASGTVAAGYGSYRTAQADLYATSGLTDTLAADLAAQFQDQGAGFGKNLFTGREVNKTRDLSLRSKWLWTPDQDTNVRLIADYQHRAFREAYVPAPGTKPPGDVPYTGDPQGLNGIFDPDGRLDQGGISLQVTRRIGALELVSTTAYRASGAQESFDGGLTRDPNSVLNLQINERHAQVTQEIQLSSAARGKVRWSAGIFLYHAVGRSDPLVITTLGAFGPPPDGLNNISVYSRQGADSLAVYGQATTEILPATNLTAGLRFTTERRIFGISEQLEQFNGAQDQVPSARARKTFDKLTWRFALDHHLSSVAMVYVSYDRGFKAGGFNDYLTPPQSYEPETLDAYQIGAKTRIAGGRVRLNAALFYYDYRNIQTVEYPQGVEIIRNAARARLYGLDLDAEASLVTGLSLTAGLEVLHDRFTSLPDATIAIPLAAGGTAFTRGDVKGNRLGFAPDYTLTAGLAYRLPATLVPARRGSVSINVDWNHNDGFFAEPENRLRQPAYDLVNGQIAWTLRDGLTKLTLWGRNLIQAVYTVALASQDTGDFAIYAPPRTVGLKIERRF